MIAFFFVVEQVGDDKAAVKVLKKGLASGARPSARLTNSYSQLLASLKITDDSSTSSESNKENSDMRLTIPAAEKSGQTIEPYILFHDSVKRTSSAEERYSAIWCYMRMHGVSAAEAARVLAGMPRRIYGLYYGARLLVLRGEEDGKEDLCAGLKLVLPDEVCSKDGPQVSVVSETTAGVYWNLILSQANVCKTQPLLGPRA
jgi:hypothetical protein